MEEPLDPDYHGPACGCDKCLGRVTLMKEESMTSLLIFAFIKLVKSRIHLHYVKWQVWWLGHHRERANHHRKILEKIVLYPRYPEYQHDKEFFV